MCSSFYYLCDEQPLFWIFCILVSKCRKKMTSLSHIAIRIINPMFMFGYLYSWQSVYAMSPLGGYLSLLNPLLYVMEGMRQGVLGQQGYLPFLDELCGADRVYVVFAVHAIVRLKKRLDCV